MLELLSKHDLEKKSKTFRKLKKYIRHDMVIRKEINIFHKLLIKEYKFKRTAKLTHMKWIIFYTTGMQRHYNNYVKFSCNWQTFIQEITGTSERKSFCKFL